MIFSGIVEKGDSFGGFSWGILLGDSLGFLDFLDFLDYLVFLVYLDFMENLVYPAPGASKSRFSFCSSLALHYL